MRGRSRVEEEIFTLVAPILVPLLAFHAGMLLATGAPDAVLTVFICASAMTAMYAERSASAASAGSFKRLVAARVGAGIALALAACAAVAVIALQLALSDYGSPAAAIALAALALALLYLLLAASVDPTTVRSLRAIKLELSQSLEGVASRNTAPRIVAAALVATTISVVISHAVLLACSQGIARLPGDEQLSSAALVAQISAGMVVGAASMAAVELSAVALLNASVMFPYSLMESEGEEEKSGLERN